MVERIVHIVSEWPSPSQTFVRDDVDISQTVFREVFVFALPFRTSKMLEVVSDLIEMLISIPRIVNRLRLPQLRKEFFSLFVDIRGLRMFALQFYKLFSAGMFLVRYDLFKSGFKTIIHAHFLSTGLEIALLVKSVNPELVVIATGHGSDVYFKDASRLRYYITRSDYIFAASQAVHRVLSANIADKSTKGQANIVLRYCRVPVIPDSPITFRKSFESQEISILTVARFHPQKGLPIAVETAKNLRDKDFNFVWKIIGDGELRSQIETLIQKYDLYDHVKLLGIRTREFVLNELLNSDIFVLPSIVTSSGSDGLPVAILEAMSLGTYVISTNVGGISEAIDTSRGSIVEANPKALSTEIENVINRGKANFVFTTNSQKWVKENCAMNSFDPLYVTYSLFSKLNS